MSESDDIDYKYRLIYGYRKPVYGCKNEMFDVKDANNNEVQKTIATDYYIYWYTGSGKYMDDPKMLHTVKMTPAAKNWDFNQKNEFIKKLENTIVFEKQIINETEKKQKFDITFYDCTDGTKTKWYSYGSNINALRGLFGGKSQKRRVIRRRRGTSRRNRKTHRSRK